ncbi:MAG: dihydrofolate reductase [Hyphomicrobiaceae bacterium]|nr:dihydrofolate reductase [Hyphomicrobiaceae bacterium]
MATTIAFVVAVARNGVIGLKGDLPWRLSSDLKLFRRLTMGKPIVMGRKTWASLPKRPLDGRDNIVVTRDATFADEGAIVAHDVEAALALAFAAADRRGTDEIAVIGGADIFRAMLPLAGRIYLTEVDAAPEGDVFFPALDPAEWHLASVEPIPRGPRDEAGAELKILERIAPAKASD